MTLSGFMSGFNVKANSNITFPYHSRTLILHQFAIGLRPAIAEELPHITHFLNLVEVEIGHDNFFLVPRSLGDDFPARRTEITLSVEFSDIPRVLVTDTINSAEEIPVCHGMRGLLELPQVFAQTGNSCRRIEYDLRPVQP